MGVFQNYYWQTRIKAWMHYASLLVMLVLMIPTSAILVSWNSVPGDYVHPIKLELESLAINAVGNNFTLASDLNSRFVSNRYEEAAILLVEQDREDGFDYLTSQVNVATEHMAVEENRVLGVNDDTESAKLIAKIEELQNTLNELEDELLSSTDQNQNQNTNVESQQPTTTNSPTASNGGNTETNNNSNGTTNSNDSSNNGNENNGSTNTNGNAGAGNTSSPQPTVTPAVGSSNEGSVEPSLIPIPSNTNTGSTTPSTSPTNGGGGNPGASPGGINQSPTPLSSVTPKPSKKPKKKKHEIKHEHAIKHERKIRETCDHIRQKVEELDSIKKREESKQRERENHNGQSRGDSRSGSRENESEEGKSRESAQSRKRD